MANNLPIQTTILYQSTTFPVNTTVETDYSYMTDYVTQTASTKTETYTVSGSESYAASTGNVSYISGGQEIHDSITFNSGWSSYVLTETKTITVGTVTTTWDTVTSDVISTVMSTTMSEGSTIWTTTEDHGTSSYITLTTDMNYGSTTEYGTDTYTTTSEMVPLLGGVNLTTTSQSYIATTSYNRKELGVYKSYLATESRTQSVETTQIGTSAWGKTIDIEISTTENYQPVLSETTYLSSSTYTIITTFNSIVNSNTAVTGVSTIGYSSTTYNTLTSYYGTTSSSTLEATSTYVADTTSTGSSYTVIDSTSIENVETTIDTTANGFEDVTYVTSTTVTTENTVTYVTDTWESYTELTTIESSQEYITIQVDTYDTTSTYVSLELYNSSSTDKYMSIVATTVLSDYSTVTINTDWETKWQTLNTVISLDLDTRTTSTMVTTEILASTSYGPLASTTVSQSGGYVATIYTNSQILNDVYSHRSVSYNTSFGISYTGTSALLAAYDGSNNTSSTSKVNTLSVPKWTATLTRNTTTTGESETDIQNTVTTTEGYTYYTITSTSFYKDAYVSVTWDRQQGDYVLQGNRKYTDRMMYMMSENYGGLSITQQLATHTSATSSRKSTYQYIGWDFVWWWWDSTTTLWNETSQASMWMDTYVDEWGWDWQAGSQTSTHYWTKTVSTWVSYYSTTTMQNMWTNSWTTTYMTASRTSGYPLNGADNLTTAFYISNTNGINTKEMTYQNLSTEMNKTMYLSVFGTGSLVKYTDIPTNGVTGTTSTIYDMGQRSLATTTKVSTYEYL